MVTDKKQTGVPNGNAFSMPGVKQRTQLVKPQQATNSGLSAPRSNVQNPLRPRQQAASQAVRQRTATPVLPVSTPAAAPATGTQEPAAAVSAATETLDSTPSAQAETPAATPAAAPADNARAAIRSMSSEEITTLLDELASGQLRGIG